MGDNTNDEKLDALEFSLNDSDLDALRNYKSVSPKKEDENTENFEVKDMEVSWEDSLEALRQERAKLNQQVLQHEPVEAVPLVFEQAVQEAIQEKSKDDVLTLMVEEEPPLPETETIEIIHDELAGSFLDEVGLVEDYDSILGNSTIHTDSVSFKSPVVEVSDVVAHDDNNILGLADDLSLESTSDELIFSLDSEPESEEELDLDTVSEDDVEEETSELKMVFDDEVEPAQAEPSVELSEFEKIKQEAMARVQNKPSVSAEKGLIKMVNPAINFNTNKATDVEKEKPADSEKKLGVGSFSAAQIAAATNMVKPQIPVVNVEAPNIKVEVKEEKNAAETAQDEIQIEPHQAATLRRAYEQDEKVDAKTAPIRSIMTPAQEKKEEKEGIPELNLAVPEKQVVYEDISAEVITQEPVSLVGEAQLITAILADVQPQLEKIITAYVRDEVMKQTASLVKNISANLEKELPNLLTETLSEQIKKAMQKVKNPLQS